MYSESVLLESRSARSGMSHHVEVLDKVKTLALAPDGVHATTRDVAAYFEVSESTVNNLLDRHREELSSNGLRILQGSDLQEFVNLTMRFTKATANSYPQRQRSLAVYSRRTVLNVAMLLRDSEVARRVRAYLLDVEAEAAPVSSALEPRVAKLESAVGDIGAMFQELGPVIHRMSVRMERIDRRMVNTERLVCEMSRRTADMGEEMRGMRTDLDHVMRATGVEPVRRRGEG
ncbi:hypothetical protein RM572_08900 [Streptomyces sp. DSM 42041]|uniref:Uncharacterized protein n=1 Tax=Streptomyces hazeniae TaxID=3075538 RepID=A0ABU2NQ56_9ACTN|nr:hypothetical protein [Streptomyces sp. DSM 42041]MDT0378889.1 hypothetical protein [Streptomyces sp. DSM 42041]